MVDLTDYLSEGQENARTAKELAAITGISDVRTIADIVHSLKVHGQIICACSQGYYLPSDRTDVLKIYRRTAGRIREIEKTLPPMEDYLRCTE